MKKRPFWVFLILILSLAVAPNMYADDCEGDECGACDEEQVDSSLVCQSKCVYSQAFGALCEEDTGLSARAYCWQVYTGATSTIWFTCHDGASDPCCDADGGGEEEGGF